MIQLKTPRIPTQSSNSMIPLKKGNLLSALSKVQSLLSGFPKANASALGTAAASNVSDVENDTDNSKSPPPKINGTAKEAQFAAFQAAVEEMNLKNKGLSTNESSITGSAKKQTAPMIIKPSVQAKRKDLLILADGGKEGASSGDYQYDQRKGKIKLLTWSETTPNNVSNVSSDYTETSEIMSSLPADFDFTGWDNKPARQQQQELQKAGLSPQDQLTLLNSSTSLETLSIIMNINENRSDYGLSVSDAKQITDELLKISNARTGTQNNALPFGASPTAKNTFLKILGEREQALLASFGYGLKESKSQSNSNNGFTDQVSDLLESDDSLSSLLHGDSNLFQVSDQYFDNMGKLEDIINDIEEGKISFQTPADQQRYLEYLTSEYEKSNNLYRQQLASEIDDAKLLRYQNTQFKQLINDLSLSQLEVLVAQVDANGLKKLARPRNFENLMKELLSDQESALNLMADETTSPICPYVWNGMDVVNESGIKISGYYYEDGVYKGIITCPNQEPFYYEIGKKLPEEVAISVEYADWGDIQTDIARREVSSLRALIEIAFQGITGIPGVQRPLPEPIGPTDVPYLGESIAEADWSNHYKTLQEGSITVSIFVHFPKDHISDYHYVDFYRD